MSCVACLCVMSLVSRSHVPHRGLPKGVSILGCLRLVGSLRLLVSFAKSSLFYRALLQKRPTQRAAQGCVNLGVSSIGRLFEIIGLFWKNLVPFIGLFCKRDPHRGLPKGVSIDTPWLVSGICLVGQWVSLTCETWLVSEPMTRAHDSLTCETWLASETWLMGSSHGLADESCLAGESCLTGQWVMGSHAMHTAQGASWMWVLNLSTTFSFDLYH